MMRNTSSPAILPASLVAWRWLSLKYAGTVITASVTVSPRYASAVSFIFCRMKALICEGAYFFPRPSTQASPLSPVMILYGTRSVSFLTIGSVKRRPISRLMAKNVFSGLVTAWRFAAWPTRRSPDSVKATIEGVVRIPSLFSITLAFLPSITATQEFVVPRSIPMTLLMDTSFQKQDRTARGSTVPIPREVIVQPSPVVRVIYVSRRAATTGRDTQVPQRLGHRARGIGGLPRPRVFFRDADHCRPQQPIVQHIAGLQHLDYRATGLAWPLGLEDRLMQIV